MIEAQPLQVLSAIRALSPLLFALLSLLLIPVARLERFGSKETSSGRAGAAVIAILLLSSAGALISGSGFASTLSAGLITVDPSEPGRLLVALGGPIFALIVVVGQGRRSGTMGQLALFGLALIDLALAIPIGLAPVVILRRHPENRDGRLSRLALDASRPQIGGEGLHHRQERAAEQPCLLSGDDHPGARIGELRRQFPGARMPV